MTRTFCAVIADPAADAVLAPYGEVLARARHWSFKQIHVLGRSVADVKREALLRFGITARQFNGVRFDLDQAVEGWRGTARFSVQRLADAAEATAERIASLGRQMDRAKTGRRRATLHFKQVGKKQRLDALRCQLARAQAEMAAGRPRVCFGGSKALRQGDVWAWRARRAGRIFLAGAKAEGVAANQSAQWDGSSLRLRLPDALGGGFHSLSGVTFRYGQEEMLAVLDRNRDPVTRVAISWLVFQAADGRWHAHATVDEPTPALVTDARRGVVAVDVNVDHLAVTLVDRCGNPTARLALAFPEAGTPEGRAAVMLGDSVRALCLLARSRGYGIAAEDLEFNRKRAGLRELGPAHARRLSGWSYARFFALLQARCSRDGIDLRAVNPAFTSVIGRLKYAPARAMTRHHAAALVIGRRAMGYGERLATATGALLDGPARNRPRAEGRRWRGVRRLPREGATAPASTAGSGTGPTPRGGRSRPAANSVICAVAKAQVTSGARTGGVPSPAWDAVAPAHVQQPPGMAAGTRDT